MMQEVVSHEADDERRETNDDDSHDQRDVGVDGVQSLATEDDSRNGETELN
jgi:hypothetical protein